MNIPFQEKILLGLLVCSFSFISEATFGQSAREIDLSSGATLYNDGTFSENRLILSGKGLLGRIKPDDGWKNYLGLNVSQTETRLKPGVDLQYLFGQSSIRSKSFGLSLDQGVGIGKNIQFGYSDSKSEIDHSNSLSVGYSQWLWDDALQLSLTIQKNEIKQEQRDFTDTDGRRILTLEKVSGTQIQGQALVYLNPNALAKTSYAMVQRNDRPAAWLLQGQFQQYIVKTGGALHLNLLHYENVGKITTKMSYGSVVANSVEVQVHQKIGLRWILVPGYRIQRESEKPRAAGANQLDRGSDFYQLETKYRLYDGMSTDNVAYVSFLTYLFKTSQPSFGQGYGLALQYWPQ